MLGSPLGNIRAPTWSACPTPASRAACSAVTSSGRTAARATGPERPDKGKAGHRRPRLTQIDLLHVSGLVRPAGNPRGSGVQRDSLGLGQQRLVADDERRVGALEHGVQIRCVRLDCRVNLEQPAHSTRDQRHRRPRARVHHDGSHVAYRTRRIERDREDGAV